MTDALLTYRNIDYQITEENQGFTLVVFSEQSTITSTTPLSSFDEANQEAESIIDVELIEND